MPSDSLLEKDYEPGDYVKVAFARKHRRNALIWHQQERERNKLGRGSKGYGP